LRTKHQDIDIQDILGLQKSSRGVVVEKNEVYTINLSGCEAESPTPRISKTSADALGVWDVAAEIRSKIFFS